MPDPNAYLNGYGACMRYRSPEGHVAQPRFTTRERRSSAGFRTAGFRPTVPLPVSKARLRWRLTLRLLLAFPAGLLIAAMAIAALELEYSAARTATFSGLVVSYALFLVITWQAGVKRRAAFAAAGGDPGSAGVLLFGVMKPRGRARGSDGSGSGGYWGDSSGNDNDGAGGDGGGGGGGDGGGGD